MWQGATANLDDMRMKKVKSLRKALSPFVVVLTACPRGQKAFQPFAGDKHSIGSHTTSTHTEQQMQATPPPPHGTPSSPDTPLASPATPRSSPGPPAGGGFPTHAQLHDSSAWLTLPLPRVDQAVRDAGDALGTLMETARTAFEEADVPADVLAPDEGLLKNLQDLYLAHDKAVEALTTSFAAVEDVMKRFQKKASKKVTDL